MTKIDLITGFLGSGKTTFIKHYVNYLLNQGEKICILENDYGAINVDTMLLSELESDNCDIEMVAGGCDYDCHKRRFKTKLITMAMLGYSRVIIEPSGIFDVDEFFDIIHESPVSSMYDLENVITIVNSEISDSLSHESEYLLASQAAYAGCIVFSHIDCPNKKIIEKLCNHSPLPCPCLPRYLRPGPKYPARSHPLLAPVLPQLHRADKPHSLQPFL